MPFSSGLRGHPLIKRALLVRGRPIAAYGTAVGLVALATLLRWAIGGYVVQGVPFVTYYPAIIVATLVAGFWPGVLSTALSAVVAWYLFMPPVGGWQLGQQEAASLLVFIFISSLNMAIVALLNAAVESVIAQEQSMRVLVQSAPHGIVVVDDQANITLVNESTERLFGYTQAELLGRSVDVLVPRHSLDAHRAARKAYLQRPEERTFRDVSGRRKDGSEFPVEIGLTPVNQDSTISVLATVVDISERKLLQESQQLIIRELQHRTRNLFAVFQAVARHTLNQSDTLAEARDGLMGRIHALAGAYATLTHPTWEGVTLEEVLRRQLSGFSKRLTVTGCDIVINASAAHQFALIAHELATNAVKHGALSTPHGRVSIEGKIEPQDGDGLLSFRWTESGGPPVAVPTRKGFGGVILQDSTRQFAQDVTMEFAPQGLVYELKLQLSAVQDASRTPANEAV